MASSNATMHRRFAAWLDGEIVKGRLPCGEIVVRHRGREVMRYRNDGLSGPRDGSEDKIYRLFSMTKPVVSLAVLQLFEEGKFQLNDPIWKFLGEKWKRQNMKVIDLAASEKGGALVTGPCLKSITIFHLLTHTSGLSHGLSPPELRNPLDEYYEDVGLGAMKVLLRPSEDVKCDDTETLQGFCDKLSECPLLFQPGDHWQYSYAVDLLGRIIEVVSGVSLEEFLKERIFSPLGMSDTSFFIPENKVHRLSDMWLPASKKTALMSIGASMSRKTRFCSGSGGLYGTANDYMVFAEMLMRGGQGSNGVRVVSPRTIEWMTTNHLKSNDAQRIPRTIRQMGVRNFANDQPPGLGFGLGVAVWSQTPTEYVMDFDGSFFWAGAAMTHFFVNRKEELAVVFCTQTLLPDPLELPVMQTLRALVYGSLRFDEPSSKL